MKRKLIRSACGLSFLALALAGCSDGDIPSFSQSTTMTITGTVSAPAGDSEQFVAMQPGGVLSNLASWVFGTVYADIVGLAPVAGATVELVQLGNGAVVSTTTTNGNGIYTFADFPTIGAASEYAVRVVGETDQMRAIVTGEVVDISPASEVVTATVLGSLGGGVVLENFLIQEVAALHAVLISMDVDVAGLDFDTAVQTIRNEAGTIFSDLVVSFSTSGNDAVLRSGDYSVVEYATALRDPFVVPVEDAPGGIEIAGGQGPMIFANRDIPSIGLIAVGKFLHDFDAVSTLYPSGALFPNAYPFVSDLGTVQHVVNGKRQLVVADVASPSLAVAGIGATTQSGGLLIYPIDYTLRVDDAPSISGMGLRYATRWRQTGLGQSLPDLTLFDPADGDTTAYHEIRLQHALKGAGAGENTVTLTTAVGTSTFDSTPQTHNFDDIPRSYGARVSDTVTDSLRLDLSDYAISASAGADLQNDLYLVLQSTGLIQFRSETGAMLGWGNTSTDGERDGEILGVNMFSGGFDEPVTATERSFSIAIRQAEEMAAADLSGTYNVVGYGGYFSRDPETAPPRAFVETGIRYGTLNLDGQGGVSAGTLFRKLARLDVAAARGETGAEANASGDSGTFMAATAGAAGETFALAVDGVTVFTFTSAAGGDTVAAEDIQAGLDDANTRFALVDAGIEVSGTVADGDLAFTKVNGAAFDIEVVNAFTGTASAAGGFAGSDFAAGSHTIDNAAALVPNASGASGAFTTATAGEAGETFTLTVGGVTVFTFTSTATGDTVTAGDVQGGVTAALAALEAIDIEVGGTVAGGNLAFTQTAGLPFTILMTNTFGGVDGAAGGFAGTDFATGTNPIDGGTEAQSATPNASGVSGPFTTATAGDAGETFTLAVGGVTVFAFTSTAIGDTVTAGDVQNGVTAALAALEAVDIAVSGTVAGGNLAFTQTAGLPFTISATNTFGGVDGAAGGFAGTDFETGTNTITGGTVAQDAVPNASLASGTFLPATSGAAGERFALVVGGVSVLDVTSSAADEIVDIAAVQVGVNGAEAALNIAGVEVSGTVAGEDLVFTRADGAAFSIVVTNDFALPGGFAGADFQPGAPAIDRGQEAVSAIATTSLSSGAFGAAVATEAGQSYALTVGGVGLFSVSASAIGQSVTAADVQAGIVANTAALNTAGIGFTGSAESGDLVFTRADGADFTIVIVNTFDDTALSAGGFAGGDFAAGEREIDNGAGAIEAVAAQSGPSGAFGAAVASEPGQTYALTVGGVELFSLTSATIGQSVTAADVQAGIAANTAALNTAGIGFTGSAESGDLVFTRADGADFTIVIVNTFGDTALSAGGFAGADFAPGAAHDIDNGQAVGINASGESGVFDAGASGAADETWSLTVGGVPVFGFTATDVGQTVTAEDVQAGIDAAAAELATAGITASGSVAAGNLAFSREDGASFAIVIVNEFTGISSTAGGFAGDDFAIGVQTIANGALAGPAPSLLSQSGEQGLSSGSYNVLANGRVTMVLAIGGEAITGQGAVSRNGDFIALATGSNSDDDTRQGRGILVLIRQP